jgi:asparagine synthase (glutamine-hydrolysing)
MCGISCALALSPGVDPGALVRVMNDKARHRGPDAAGVEVVGNVALGHTRLSIIDLSDRSNQPMLRDGRWISFNGEIYNFRDLQRQLEALGHHFTTASDTEVLLVALAHWGVGALDRLKGMFAFALLDPAAGELLLARDRFGKKPLVYARRGDALLVASEAKQIVAAAGGRPTPNLNAALGFLTESALNFGDETFFAGVSELRAGHWAKVDTRTGAMRIERWYDLGARIRRTTCDYEEARENVRSLLKAAVDRRLVADVRLGACLSGGIDSSSIVAVSNGLRDGKPFPTITAYADADGFDERRFSRDVVAQFGLQSIEIQPDVSRIWRPEQLGELCYYQDQPVKSGSQFSEYCVFQAARQAGVTVMLDGQGSDEYFGGYGEFWLAAQVEALRAGRFLSVWEALRRRADALGISVARAAYNFSLSLRAAFSGAGRRNEAPRAWLRAAAPEVPERAPARASFDELALREMTQTSVPFQVHSEDRNSMRWSVESRLPFLDHELVEYVLGLPTDFKCAHGRQKSLLRDAVAELPPSVAQRKDKIGFALPDALAMRDSLSSVRGALCDSARRLARIIDPEIVVRDFDAMVEKGGYDPKFLRILSLDAWCEAFGAAF